MNKVLRIMSMGLSALLIVYGGCSGGDEPKPVNCASSDLAITVATSVNPTDCSVNDGVITAVVTGGKGPYKIKLGSTGSFGTALVFSGLGGGQYTLFVEDANDCSDTFTTALVTPGGPTATVTETTENTNCLAPHNGSATLSASGGTGPYEYKIDAGSFSAASVFQFLKHGDHTAIVRDAEGCTVNVSINVPQGDTGTDYVNNILPIFQSKCQFSGCHPDNGNWFDYNTAKGKADLIKQKTGDRSMPKGGSSAPGGALSDSQIALIACWVDGGAPEN